MLAVGLTMDTVRAFISKQCIVNALPSEQRDDLIVSKRLNFVT
jgi:hypothetical protein